MAGQREINDGAVTAVRDFLGGPWPDGNGWRFEFGHHLSSNWGSVYGGATSAAAVALARLAAPDRSPRSLHVQMLRSLPCGVAMATTRLRHAGRTVTTTEAELYDSEGKLAAVGLVTSVLTESLSRDYSNTRADVFDVSDEAVDLDAMEAADAPIAHALHMSGVSRQHDHQHPAEHHGRPGTLLDDRAAVDRRDDNGSRTGLPHR